MTTKALPDDSLGLVLRQHRAAQEAQRALLEKPLTDEDFVFAHPDGTPLGPSTVSHTFNKIIHKAGLPPCQFAITGWGAYQSSPGAAGTL